MAWKFNDHEAVFIQIVNRLRSDILSGKYPPDSKFPPVRQLAYEAAVNPNTMQKALSELEWEKLLYTMRTAGRYVTEDAALIGVLREQLAQERIIGLLNELQQLGYQNEEILNLLQRYMKGEIANDSVSGI